MPRPSKQGYPVILWTADNKHLIQEIFNILHDNNTIKRGIWPQRGKLISSHNKAIYQKNLAEKLLKDEKKIMPLLKDSKALTHYGNAVKYPIAKLEKSWKAVKETLGVTGAGLPNKKAI